MINGGCWWSICNSGDVVNAYRSSLLNVIYKVKKFVRCSEWSKLRKLVKDNDERETGGEGNYK